MLGVTIKFLESYTASKGDHSSFPHNLASNKWEIMKSMNFSFIMLIVQVF